MLTYENRTNQFFIDKYRPSKSEQKYISLNIKDKIYKCPTLSKFDIPFFHKDIIKQLKIMSKDNEIPHIIFFGQEGSGKQTLINLFLEMLFDETVHNVKDVEYEVLNGGNKKILEKIRQSNYHIEIDPKNNNYDRYLIHDIVKEYVKIKTFKLFKTNRNFKVVLINNLDNSSKYAQTALRRTMEIYNDHCRFIMWCSSLSKVIKPLQSRCVCIRVPSPSKTELFDFLLSIISMEKIKLSIKELCEIVNDADGNIKKPLWFLQSKKYGFIPPNTDYKKIIKIMVDLMITKDTENIISIRTNFFSLTITNISPTVILKDIINLLCYNNKITFDCKQELVKLATEYEYQLIKGRRSVIQFEAFVISAMNIIKVI